MKARQIIENLNESRFFVYLADKDRERADHFRVMSHRHAVLDRETVVDGHYKVMAQGMDYIDAFKLARSMNADPEQANALAQFEPKAAPVHNVGSEYAPQRTTF